MVWYQLWRGIGVETEFAVIGGGIVGLSLAFGLQRLGKQVTVFDEGDQAFRASRGNFGLVWVQGKGAELPDYARWTRLSASLWPSFRDELEGEANVRLELNQTGGLDICLSEGDLEAAVTRLEGLCAALGGDYPYELLGHNALKELVPETGPTVAGATFSPEDGHVNPLYLMRALHAAFVRRGGTVTNGSRVKRIAPQSAGFLIDNGAEHRAHQVVLAAGLGNGELAPMVGLDAPVKPSRGQILVTERVKPFLNYATAHIRQVGEGAVQIGDSKEDVGFNDETTPNVAAAIARRAMRIFPILEHVRVVRTWGALRVMSPDGFPIYQQSTACPGASLVTCHSGVTLAAAHTLELAPWIGGGARPPYVESFGVERFQLPTSA